jgi:hypothetical protein
MATLHIEHPISDLQTWLDSTASKRQRPSRAFFETTLWASPALAGAAKARVLTEVG